MKCPKEFLDIQIRYAEKYASITKESTEGVLFTKTCFYTTVLGLGFDFNENNVYWKQFIDTYKVGGIDGAYDFHVKFYDKKESLGVSTEDREKRFGCFSYHIDDRDGTLWVHFSNNDKSGYGPLSSKVYPERLKELKDMFSYIKTHYPEVATVKTVSWMFNLASYNRLYPPKALESLKEMDFEQLKYLSSWGQFLNSEGRVKEDLKAQFLVRIEDCTSEKELLTCFPYKTLGAEVPITIFYEYYGV